MIDPSDDLTIGCLAVTAEYHTWINLYHGPWSYFFGGLADNSYFVRSESSANLCYYLLTQFVRLVCSTKYFAMDVEETPVPLPSAPSRSLGPYLTLQPPLSRQGRGPGLLVICPDQVSLDGTQDTCTLDPPPLQKWAEEGYAVVRVGVPISEDQGPMKEVVRRGIDALAALVECDEKDQIGLIGTSCGLLLSLSSFHDLPFDSLFKYDTARSPVLSDLTW